MTTPGKQQRPGGATQGDAGKSFDGDTNSVPVGADNPIPAVPVIGITEGRTTRTATIRCPFCARLHTHGWPYSDGDNNPGHRVAHCKRGRLWGYEIVLSGGVL